MRNMSLSKKVFITGIDGFTGKHLEVYLNNHGYEVSGTTIDYPRQPNHYQCDLRNYNDIQSLITKINPDYIFHLAAISFTAESDRSLIYDTNVIGTENLLQAIQTQKLNPHKIIIASSASVYGNQEASELIETMCPEPVNHYGLSKLAMEYNVKTYFDTLNILIVRPFNYTGPGQSSHFLIPKLVKHYKQKQTSIELGNLSVAREFNDIRFVLDAYHQLMLSSINAEIINLCTGRTWTLTSIIDILNELFEYEIKIKTNPIFCRANEIPVLKGSIHKLNSIITPDTSYSITDTLRFMYE